MQHFDFKDDLGLPSELVLHIISFADPQTLGRCAQLSFELLRFVSPFLYRKVALNNAESYGQLFCERDPTTSHPRLHPFLSLDQIQHLHFHIDSSSPSLMFPHRISSSPLRLKSLELTYHDLAPGGRHHDIYSQILPSTLICSLPLSTRFDRPIQSSGWTNQTAVKVGPHCMSAMVRAWRNVPTLVLAGALPVLGRRADNQDAVFAAVNDDRELTEGMTVVMDLTNRLYKLPDVQYMVFGLALKMHGSPVGGQSWKVVVQVCDEAEAGKIRRGVGNEAKDRVEVVVMGRSRVPMEEEE